MSGESLGFLMDMLFFLISRKDWKTIDGILLYLASTPEVSKENLLCGLRITALYKKKLIGWNKLFTKAEDVFGDNAKEVLNGLNQ